MDYTYIGIITRIRGYFYATLCSEITEQTITLNPKKTKHLPHCQVPTLYGRKDHVAPLEDETPPFSPQEKKNTYKK